MDKIKTFEKIRKINIVTNEIDSTYHLAALKLGLSDSTMFVLYMICDNGGSCRLNEIHGAGMCKQTVNSAVRKMEAEGLLYLDRCGGRKKTAVLTEKGRELAERTITKLMSAEEGAFSSWTAEEIDIFIELNRKYLDCFRSQIEKM